MRKDTHTPYPQAPPSAIQMRQELGYVVSSSSVFSIYLLLLLSDN